MASTGWLPFGAAVNQSGEGDVAWSNPTNALTDNASAASAGLTAGNPHTQRLDLTGADLSAIPDGATIDGIEVRFRRRQTANHARDLQVQLLIEGTAAGEDKETSSNWSTTPTTITYGGEADLWGLTPTAAQIKAATSGLRIRARRQSGSPTAEIQFAEINVHYTGAALPPGTLTAGGKTWNALVAWEPEIEGPVAAGEWSARLAIECGAGSGLQEVRVRLVHRDDECGVKEELFDVVSSVALDTTRMVQFGPVTLEAVTFEADDVLTLEVYDESGNATKTVHWGGAPGFDLEVSSLVHPSEGEVDVPIVRVVNETLEVSEDDLRSREMTRIRGQMVALAEAGATARVMARVRAEPLEIVEDATHLRAMARAQAEALEIAETTDSVRGLSRAIAEAVETSETLARVLAAELAMIVNEAVDVAEATVRALGLARIRAETVQAAETSLAARLLARVRDEAVEVAEAPAVARALARVRAEMVQAAETTAGIVEAVEQALVQVISEAIAIAETAAGFVQAVEQALVQIVAELIETAEATTRALGLTRLRAETIEAAEATTVARALARIRTEFIGIAETAAGFVEAVEEALVAVINEAIEIGEATVNAVETAIVRVIAEAVNVAEALARSASLTRVRNEAVQAGEQIARARELIRIRAEAVTLGEATLRARAMVRQLAETVRTVEVREFARGFAVVVNETVQTAEAAASVIVEIIAGFLRAVLRVVPLLGGHPGGRPAVGGLPRINQPD